MTIFWGFVLYALVVLIGFAFFFGAGILNQRDEQLINSLGIDINGLSLINHDGADSRLLGHHPVDDTKIDEAVS